MNQLLLVLYTIIIIGIGIYEKMNVIELLDIKLKRFIILI